MRVSDLDPSLIRRGASDESYARGITYFYQGAVGPLMLRDGLLQANVVGSAHEPYRVTVALADGGVRSADCTCPYDWGGWCKHIVATLLAFSNAGPGDVQVRPPLYELLGDLDRDQLVALVLRLAEQESTVADHIDALLGAVPLRPVAAAGAQPPVDTASFSRQLRHAFAHADDYGAGEQMLMALEPLATQIRALVAGDDPEVALSLLEKLTEEYSERWLEYDDSEGELGEFFGELGRLWAEALLEADLPRGEREAWEHRLGAWHDTAENYGIEGLGVALRAADEGWDAPWLAPALRGELATPMAELDWEAKELLPIRLRVLERKGLARDALHLAAATGLYREQALILARLGKGEAALLLARQTLQAANDLLALAMVLLERGDSARALLVGELGLGKAPPRAPLARWLLEFAASEGRAELAIRAGDAALRETPELELFKRMEQLSGEEWPSRRERLLKELRSAGVGWQSARGLIDIWLHEGLIDDAIKVAGHNVSGNELVRVAEAAVATRPAWALITATAQAEKIMSAGDASRYAIAIEWLRLARAANAASGQPEAWEAALQELRARHRRKYKLMELLDRLEMQG
jgi:uncharacterized Zn finger protein